MTAVEYETGRGERVRLAICADRYEQGGALALLALNVTDPVVPAALLDALVGAGVIELSGRSVRSGFCSYPPLATVPPLALAGLRGYQETVRELAPLTVVLEWEDNEGGGAEEWDRAPRGEVLAALVASASSEADALAAGGCEWAAVRVGVGGVEDVDCETGETVHVAEGR